MALGQGLFNRTGGSSQKKSINVYSNYRMTNSKDIKPLVVLLLDLHSGKVL